MAALRRICLLLLACFSGLALTQVQAQTPEPPLRFAVIGDFGQAGRNAQAVADLVHSWDVDVIITTGDNNYSVGSAATIDQNVGQYYHDFIAPYSGIYGEGALENRFFPVLGNHDWLTPKAKPYLDYFTLPGNERYYTFTQGPVQFFAIDNNYSEPDGFRRSSVQAQWLQQGLAASTAPWKVVYMHIAPYSSGHHGSNAVMQWPFAAWGADVVLAGHDHDYERLQIDGIPYIVNGVGGAALYDFETPLEQSLFRYNDDYGAMRVTADLTQITFDFYAVTDGGTLIDSYTLTQP